MTPKEAAKLLIDKFHIEDLIDKFHIEDLIDKFHIEDQVYDVRNRAVENDPAFTGNSWDHPDVTEFAEACRVLREFSR